MVTNKTSSPIFNMAFRGVLIISLTGIVLLMVIVYELAESGLVVPNIMQTYFSFRQALQNNTGNEFTGEATAWLFGASAFPVAIDLISRNAIRYVPLGGTIKSFIRVINNFQRKYLMPFHTYLSIIALGLGILHLVLSSCIANPFPELGLIITGLLVTTGLLFKWNAIPKRLCKPLYKFHASLIVSGVLLAVLVAGHAVMGTD
jgi:hypothetical protein